MLMQLLHKVFGLLLILSIATIAQGQTAAAPKVTVITGIGKVNTKRIGTIQPVFDGIREGLQKKNIVPKLQFVELVAIDESIKASVGTSALAITMSDKPDLVITLTDDALKYMGTKINNIPVVFAWIFNNPYSLGLPKANITGVTRGSHAASIWSLAKQLTGAKTVLMVSKDNESMQGAKQYIEANQHKLKLASGVQLTDIKLVNRFIEWTDVIKNCKSGMIYLADTSRIDRNGPMKSEEIVRWTVANATVPVIAAAEKDVKAGALLAFVTDDKAIGLRVADLALKILNGAKPSDIPYVTNARGSLVINRSTARKYGILLPREVLSWAVRIYD